MNPGSNPGSPTTYNSFLLIESYSIAQECHYVAKPHMYLERGGEKNALSGLPAGERDRPAPLLFRSGL